MRDTETLNLFTQRRAQKNLEKGNGGSIGPNFPHSHGTMMGEREKI